MLPIEILEKRRMLSVQWNQDDDIIHVRGTDKDDVIVVERSQSAPNVYVIFINGQENRIARKAVEQIYIEGRGGNDRIDLSQFEGTMEYYLYAKGGVGSDLLIGSSTDDQLSGGDGNDTLIGNAGADELDGEDGDDQLRGGDGNDYVYGQEGKDTLFGSAGFDELYGGNENDLIMGGGGNDLIYGDEGDDLIQMGAGNDLTDAGEGNDTVFGGNGDDALCGDEGNDVLWGEGGNDFLLGDDDKMLEPWGPNYVPGNDKLDGGDGNDTLMGSHQSDTYAYDNGKDTMTGGKGDDYIDARGNDVLTDRSTGGAMGKDHVPVLDNHASSDQWVVNQAATLSIFHRTGLFSSGEYIKIPAGVGQFGQFPTVFTSDDSGTIHLRDTKQRDFKLSEFFENWGYDTADGRVAGLDNFEMYINGQSTDEGPNLVVHDGDKIEIVYGHRRFR